MLASLRSAQTSCARADNRLEAIGATQKSTPITWLFAFLSALRVARTIYLQATATHTHYILARAATSQLGRVRAAK